MVLIRGGLFPDKKVEEKLWPIFLTPPEDLGGVSRRKWGLNFIAGGIDFLYSFTEESLA